MTDSGNRTTLLDRVAVMTEMCELSADDGCELCRLVVDLSEAIERGVALAEGALLGTAGRRAIWTDADFLCAILATLTGDGDRARRASIAEFARRPNEDDE